MPYDETPLNDPDLRQPAEDETLVMIEILTTALQAIGIDDPTIVRDEEIIYAEGLSLTPVTYETERPTLTHPVTLRNEGWAIDEIVSGSDWESGYWQDLRHVSLEPGPFAAAETVTLHVASLLVDNALSTFISH